MYSPFVFLDKCYHFSLGSLVHLNAEIDKYNKTDASNVWIYHTRHSEGIIDAMSKNWS